MTAGGVLPKRAPMTKAAARDAVAMMLTRLALAFGPGTVADYAGCSGRTVADARAGKTLPELHSVINLLVLDPSALDELLAPMGFRLVQIDQAGSAYPQMLASLADVTATTAGALADGRVDHREEAQIMARLRQMLPDLNAAVARHDAKRVAG